jgi:hypothetical protein
MSKRHEKIAFKQIVRLEWMDMTLSLVLAGYSELEIREQLDQYLSTQRQSGGVGKPRNKATYGMSIGLLSCWFRKEPELVDFRKALLEHANRVEQKDWLPLHWAMLASSYPYFVWVNEHVGRLFSLQDSITSGQVYERMKQTFGDKEMVARNARYVVRTLVSWGLLEEEKGKKGQYRTPAAYQIQDSRVTELLLEGLLLAIPDERCELNALLRHRALYGFSIDYVSPQELSRLSKNRISLSQVGLTTGMVAIERQHD